MTTDQLINTNNVPSADDPSTQSGLAKLMASQGSLEMLSEILDSLPMQVVLYDVNNRDDIRMVYANQQMYRASGFIPDMVIGKRIYDFLSPEEAKSVEKVAFACYDNGTTIESLDLVTVPSGQMWLQSWLIPIKRSDGTIKRMLSLMQDVTEQKQRELEDRQRQEDIIVQQQVTLAELSTPLLTISDDTLVMPLIGAVDSQRVTQLIDTLLHGVSSTRASTVILDITGVVMVDTQVANAFIQASQAVNLLGAQIVLTGIRPEVAQILVGLGVDLKGIITRSSLRDGISYALEHA
jgi:rsbT co-antagonist protein RsbR